MFMLMPHMDYFIAGYAARNARLQVSGKVGLASLPQHNRFIVKSSALPETFASVAIAAVVVGAATTLLVKRTKTSQELETPSKMCDDCGGSGICTECKGEGFTSKQLPEKTAEKARTTAKNMATRYTAGLPRKWSYCTKCSSARSCVTCGGSGRLNL
ncbi:hypothetical protein V2J09_008971 [Rumex salicifolius]